MLTSRQLRYFVEIVDAGSFSLAAERLFIAQSALSRQVRDMEQALKVTLLVRDPRGLDLTPAGRSLYGNARRILAALDDAAVSAVHAERGTEGTVHLLHSSSVPPGPALLAAIARHVDAHPGVSIEIATASSEHQAHEIHEGRADLGLAREPILRRYADLQYTPLYREPLMAIVPDAHPLAAHRRLTVSALRDERFVALAHQERGGLGHRVAELCRVHGFSPQPAAVRSRKWSQLALVEAGLGVAIVPASMARMAPAGVKAIAIADANADSGVLAICRQDATAITRRLADALVAAHTVTGAPSD
ncbi:LysR family transcriptional regulator [Pigmentiphaga litoralis]|uniref:LysR family transcriptional regulator n=1 Tax=Pigmentiphaga litoralis TaxID=516702 RepID=UPI003B437222